MKYETFGPRSERSQRLLDQMELQLEELAARLINPVVTFVVQSEDNFYGPFPRFRGSSTSAHFGHEFGTRPGQIFVGERKWYRGKGIKRLLLHSLILAPIFAAIAPYLPVW